MTAAARDTGYLRWPHKDNGFHRTGENGMWVYAFWRAAPTAQLDTGMEIFDPDAVPRTPHDPFVLCHGPSTTLALPLPDAVATIDDTLYNEAPYVGPTGNAVERLAYLESTLDAGAPILAGICLGTTDQVYANDSGEYWFATAPDLTRKGRRLTEMVSGMYGNRPCELLTYVDT